MSSPCSLFDAGPHSHSKCHPIETHGRQARESDRNSTQTRHDRSAHASILSRDMTWARHTHEPHFERSCGPVRLPNRALASQPATTAQSGRHRPLKKSTRHAPVGRDALPGYTCSTHKADGVGRASWRRLCRLPRAMAHAPSPRRMHLARQSKSMPRSLNTIIARP